MTVSQSAEKGRTPWVETVLLREPWHQLSCAMRFKPCINYPRVEHPPKSNPVSARCSTQTKRSADWYLEGCYRQRCPVGFGCGFLALLDLSSRQSTPRAVPSAIATPETGARLLFQGCVPLLLEQRRSLASKAGAEGLTGRISHGPERGCLAPHFGLPVGGRLSIALVLLHLSREGCRWPYQKAYAQKAHTRRGGGLSFCHVCASPNGVLFT